MTPTNVQTTDLATKVRLGTLRRDEPDKCWGGLGNGWTCDGCERTIAGTEFEIEADFDLGATTLHFHIACFLEWHRATAPAGPVLRHPGHREGGTT